MSINDSLKLSLTGSLAHLESLTEAPSDQVHQLLWKIAKRQADLMSSVQVLAEDGTDRPETVQQFIKKLMAQAGSLSTLAALHPTLTSANLTQPISDEIAKAVRAQFVEVFSQTGTFIGRNLPEAIRADTRIAIKQSFESSKLPPFIAKKGRGHVSDPKGFIRDHLAPLLDSDQKSYMYDMSVYNILNLSGVSIHPLYKALQRHQTFKD